MVERARCDHPHLGREVALDRRRPCGFDPRCRILREHLGGRQHDPRRDLEPSLELLLGEEGDHARIAREHLRPVLVENGDHLLDRSDHREPRRSAATDLHRGNHLLGEVQRTRRTDTHDACLRRHPEPCERPDEDRDPVRELGLRVEEEPGHACGAGRREDAVLAAIERSGVGAREEQFELGHAKAPVGDDPIELLHQHALGERRQVGELRRLGAGPERLAVVRGVRDGVADQGAGSLPLVVDELLARPAVALEERRGLGREPRRVEWVGRGCGSGRHV